MRVGKSVYRAVNWHMESKGVQWVEQRLLPHRFEQVASQNPEDVAVAIESMQVRGAPTIGATAAYGLALAWKEGQERFNKFWLPRFRATRPTAVNLFHACDAMQLYSEQNPTISQMIERADAYADAYAVAQANAWAETTVAAILPATYINENGIYDTISFGPEADWIADGDAQVSCEAFANAVAEGGNED